VCIPFQCTIGCAEAELDIMMPKALAS